MTTETTKLNPMTLWTDSLAAWGELGQSARKTWTDAMSSMQPGADIAASEDATKELFRKLADMNLQHWENTAKVIEAMPTWMRWPQTVPGGVLTDWFDQMRRNAPASMFASYFNLSDVTGEDPEDAVRRPVSLSAPEGEADDLTQIKGIGPKLSQTLNEIGVYHFSQIAAWEDAEALWVDDYLSFKGRVAREKWIEQAEKLAANVSLH